MFQAGKCPPEHATPWDGPRKTHSNSHQQRRCTLQHALQLWSPCQGMGPSACCADPFWPALFSAVASGWRVACPFLVLK